MYSISTAHYVPALEILAVYSSKGGVGKTTACVNLAHASSVAGWPTVLWDLDPQGAATYVLEAEQGIKGGIKKLIGGRRDLVETVESTVYERLDIVPADRSYRHIDVHLHKQKNPATRLIKVMRPLAEHYAALFLDCAPGMSLVSENVMRAADGLVIPVLPAPLSVRMLEQLVAFVEKERWQDLHLLPFFSMVDRRRSLHRQTIDEIRRAFPFVLETEIPYNSEIERLSVRRKPLAAYAPRSEGALAFNALWREIDARLESRFSVTQA